MNHQKCTRVLKKYGKPLLLSSMLLCLLPLADLDAPICAGNGTTYNALSYQQHSQDLVTPLQPDQTRAVSVRIDSGNSVSLASASMEQIAPGGLDPLWARLYDTSNAPNAVESLLDIAICKAGGYALIGWTNSTVPVSAGDVWLVRTDDDGMHLWNKTYGTAGGTDMGVAITECSTGGFAIAASTDSIGAGGFDVWLIRTADNGTALWNCTYGGIYDDYPYAIVEVSTGGFVIVGSKYSPATYDDVWLIRTNSTGHVLWNHTYPAQIVNSYDRGYDVVECSDGGFAVTGYTTPVPIVHNCDVLLLKTASNGTELWRKSYDGGWDHDYGYSLVECEDHGFAISGRAEGFYTNYRWVLRTDSDGELVWSDETGGPSNCMANSIIECKGGGFAVVSSGMYPSVSNATLLRLDSSGNHRWQQTYGGTGYDSCNAIVQCSDESFVLVGSTQSFGVSNQAGRAWQVPDTPYWLEDPDDQIQEFGSDFRYDLNATASLALDAWWVNDTSHFTVDSLGVITQASLLPVGEFGLAVWVNDTRGNLLNGNFTVTVTDITQPIWSPALSTQNLELGQSFHYDANATDLSGLDTWWLNDTAHFDISSQGVVTNVVPLAVGRYGLWLNVNDTFGNILGGGFSVIVSDNTPPDWVVTPNNMIVLHGQPLEYQLQATDLSGINLWTINDTMHFELSGNGLLTNKTHLSVGQYGLAISVYDLYDNVLNTTITVKVESETTTTGEPTTWQIPDYLIPAVGLSLAVVIVIVIVYRIRKPSASS